MSSASVELRPNELEAIETFFDGDQAFYLSFRQSCVEQFVVDIETGDAACRMNDSPTLRRTAHSLKSVMQSLGYPELSALARTTEESAKNDPLEVAVGKWQALRRDMASTFALSV